MSQQGCRGCGDCGGVASPLPPEWQGLSYKRHAILPAKGWDNPYNLYGPHTSAMAMLCGMTARVRRLKYRARAA